MRNLLPLWFKKQMYYALVQSYLHYCLLVWGRTTQSNLQSLFVLQNKSIRAISNINYRDSTNEHWSKLGLLNIHNLKTLRVALEKHHLLKNDTTFSVTLHDPQKIRHIHFDRLAAGITPLCRKPPNSRHLNSFTDAALRPHSTPCYRSTLKLQEAPMLTTLSRKQKKLASLLAPESTASRVPTRSDTTVATGTSGMNQAPASGCGHQSVNRGSRTSYCDGTLVRTG